MILEEKVQRKKEEIKSLQTKLKKKKMELNELQLRIEMEEKKEKAEFNEKIVQELESRYGKLSEEKLHDLFQRLELNSSDIL